jgi:hypothetical protein
MVEPMMFFALGALAAGLFALAILPLVHARAVRLATRRLETNTPVSLAQIRADKDLLRAEFAVAARRFEMTIEQLKTRMTDQLAELGRKTDEISRLKLKLGEKTVPVPQARHRTPIDDGLTSEPERSAERPPIRLADLAKLNPDVAQSPLVPGFDEIASTEPLLAGPEPTGRREHPTGVKPGK